ncbi:MAG TPA: gamma-glutamyl-gamma-aminobutyrate hydrolase family protein [Burkholderiaceae bacterium]|nr:gamma-glutamyl-gamma-aminobutyrate hydrolase family protein [Burkholderiaceae bacterium]
MERKLAAETGDLEAPLSEAAVRAAGQAGPAEPKPAHAAPEAIAPRLRIGLSARILHREAAHALGFRNKSLQYLESSVAHWILTHGALVFMLPTLEAGDEVKRANVSIRDYVDVLDGLVLQGGADVSPTTYGEDPRRPEWQGDRVRDLFEIELLWAFIFAQKPVLGICRGAQLVNVAFNGTLHQDVAEEIPHAIRHVDREEFDKLHHEVAFEHGSRLAALYGEDARLRVNSIHHQAVKLLGNGLVVEARSPSDGVIEAIRWTGSSYVMGVQWHPEFHPGSGSDLLDSGPIMQEFLAHARTRKRADQPVASPARPKRA